MSKSLSLGASAPKPPPMDVFVKAKGIAVERELRRVGKATCAHHFPWFPDSGWEHLQETLAPDNASAPSLRSTRPTWGQN